MTTSTKSAKKSTKTAAAKPAARKSAVAKPAARKSAVAKPKSVAKPSAAKKPLAKATSRAVTAAVPRQRSRAAAPAPAVKAPAAPVARRPRPIVVSARRSDGRGLSFTERLGAAMHKRLGHDGPVCHNCRMNSSQLAAAAQAPSPLAI